MFKRNKKEVISKKENRALHESLKEAYCSYMILNPEKYESFKSVCYVDMMEEYLIPYFKTMAIAQGRAEDKQQIALQAHLTWLECVNEGVLDVYSRVITNGKEERWQ